MNTLPTGYEERVYAGVLGKIIGVYLGRPFEGWTNQKIEAELGEIHYYVHDRLNVPLVVADDDISGTFTFIRALSDHGTGHHITPEEIGKTWLNYLIEGKTVLWWGGLGNSTEHTAYLRLKSGLPAPLSGAIETNGQIVAEQIGAQIFIDGWAMVCPGDPEKAALLAGKAASVSHDGEAMYAAQVIAAMEALAFIEDDLMVLLNTAQTVIPRSSKVYELIDDMRQWKEEEEADWRVTLRKIEKKWGYDTYGGGCHVLPNHALILLGLLYGDDDFQKSLMIVNTAGWDTDCNSANVGCILGIKNGLDTINHSVDFRGPVADRLYLPTADGGRCITDAAREAYAIINIARTMQGQHPHNPNGNMRFHFNLPGAVHGFKAEPSATDCTVRVDNIRADEIDLECPSDERMLAIRYTGVGPGRPARVATPTFLPPEALSGSGYGMTACPILYSGQTVRARIIADDTNPRVVPCRLYAQVYGAEDKREIIHSDYVLMEPGDTVNHTWIIPDTGGKPIAELGVEVTGHAGSGAVYMDWMGMGGTPNVTFTKPEGKAARKAWVNAVSELREWGVSKSFGIIQNEDTGLLYQGDSTWSDYIVDTVANAHLAYRVGIVAAVRGLRRYIALVLDRPGEEGRARLIEMYDDMETVLEECPFPWELYQDIPLVLIVRRNGMVAGIVGEGARTSHMGGVTSYDRTHGAAGMLVTAGHCQFGDVLIRPIPQEDL